MTIQEPNQIKLFMSSLWLCLVRMEVSNKHKNLREVKENKQRKRKIQSCSQFPRMEMSRKIGFIPWTAGEFQEINFLQI